MPCAAEFPTRHRDVTRRRRARFSGGAQKSVSCIPSGSKIVSRSTSRRLAPANARDEKTEHVGRVAAVNPLGGSERREPRIGCEARRQRLLHQLRDRSDRRECVREPPAAAASVRRPTSRDSSSRRCGTTCRAPWAICFRFRGTRARRAARSRRGATPSQQPSRIGALRAVRIDAAPVFAQRAR